MHFTFALNLYLTLSSVENLSNSLNQNLAQHFVLPENVLPDQVITVRYFRGYNKWKLNHHMKVSSAFILCKHYTSAEKKHDTQVCGAVC